MTKKQALIRRNKIYRKLPQHLNSLGFEMALFLNFGYAPDASVLKIFYTEYDKVRSR